MNITITIAPSPEFLAALNRIADSFKPAPATEEPKKQIRKKEVEAPVKESVETAPVASEPVDEAIPEKIETPAPVKQITEAAITPEQLRAAVAEKTTSGKKGEVKALLNSYNATKLSELSIADFTSFLTELKAL